MKTSLTLKGRDEGSWEETKPIVLAAMMKAIDVKRVVVKETYLKLVIETDLYAATNAMKWLLKYFKQEYGGSPLQFTMEVYATNDRPQ